MFCSFKEFWRTSASNRSCSCTVKFSSSPPRRVRWPACSARDCRRILRILAKLRPSSPGCAGFTWTGVEPGLRGLGCSVSTAPLLLIPSPRRSFQTCVRSWDKIYIEDRFTSLTSCLFPAVWWYLLLYWFIVIYSHVVYIELFISFNSVYAVCRRSCKNCETNWSIILKNNYLWYSKCESFYRLVRIDRKRIMFNSLYIFGWFVLQLLKKH